jgi:all-trans-retinol dehydrogenase (NAD+)
VLLTSRGKETVFMLANPFPRFASARHTLRSSHARSSQELVYSTAKKVTADLGDCTILINNAGIVTGKSILDVEDSKASLTLGVNTESHFWTVKAFLPHMIATDNGHIVTIASAAGLVGVAGLCDYCASKFGARGFNEALRLELRKMKKYNVHTLSVCPYFINTGMFDGVKTR